MNQKELMILHSDRQYIVDRIEELDREIRALGPEFQDVFNQSSETWHDNAPFDALRDRQALLDAERHGLKKILWNSVVIQPSTEHDTIGIACVVELEAEGQAPTRLFIAGDWNPFVGHEKHGARIISKTAPLVENFIGKAPSYEFDFRGTRYRVLTVEYPEA